MYRVRGKGLANVWRMYRVRRKGWRMSGECIESGQKGWRMSGECIESGQTRQNGHFGEYSNSPNWRIFGEYSNSTNSPASGHCLQIMQDYSRKTTIVEKELFNKNYTCKRTSQVKLQL